MTPLRLEAPAKVNLALAVVGRRPDGFHELVSDLVLLELADRLLLLPGSAGLRVEAATPELAVPPGRGENLAWRGLVAGAGGEPDLVCLALEKGIAVAAGLGGGSSDAAAAWRLGRHWIGAPEPAADAEVRALASIGADVPFFAAMLPAARVDGIGERVRAVAPPAGGALVVLAHPPFGLATAAVFAELRPSDWSGEIEPGRNDLLAPARRLRPELDDLMRLMAAAGAGPQLSGSGPTVFARMDDPERAAGVVERLRRAGVRATLTRLRREAASIESLDEPQEEIEG